MRDARTTDRGWAKVTLGLSMLFAVGAFVYFALGGAPLNGVLVGVLVVGAGIWEYRRRLQDERVAKRYEAEAEERRSRDRR